MFVLTYTYKKEDSNTQSKTTHWIQNHAIDKSFYFIIHTQNNKQQRQQQNNNTYMAEKLFLPNRLGLVRTVISTL
jgi:hypothetical protein